MLILWGFYIFTIITNGTHQIIILRITPTTIPAERSLSFIFTIFADVARHASACTRSAGSSEMSFLPLICSSLPSLHSWVLQLISLPCGHHTTAPSPTSSSACGETETKGKGGAQAHVHELEVVLERGADGAVTASSAAAPSPLTRHTCPSRRRRRREGGPLRWAVRSGGGMGAGATSSTANGL